jgi:hypothetical protein
MKDEYVIALLAFFGFIILVYFVLTPSKPKNR